MASVLFRPAFLLVAAVFSVTDAGSLRSSSRDTGGAAAGQFDYTYNTHGLDWNMGQCGSRARQSPIDFEAGTPLVPMGPLLFKYKTVAGKAIEILNTGHVYVADVAGLDFGGIIYSNNYYALTNINLHAKSEHTFTGKHYPLEMHLIHKHVSSDQLLITAIPFHTPSAGPAPGPAPAPAPAPGPAFLQAQTSGKRKIGDRRFTAWGRDLEQHHNCHTSNATGHRQLPPVLPVPGMVRYNMPTFPPLYSTTTPAPPTVPIGYYDGPCNPGTPSYFGYTPPSADEAEFNQQLQKFLDFEPPPVNMRAQVPITEDSPLNLNALYEGGMFYHYAGSLTGPPCAEIATWVVRSTPVSASQTQLLYLQDGIYRMNENEGNYRQVMPLNGRVIGAMEAQPIPQPPPTHDVNPPPLKSIRQRKVLKWAKDALSIAKSATKYVKQLDDSMRNSAGAHVHVFEPQPLLPTTTPAPPTTAYPWQPTTPTPTTTSAAPTLPTQSPLELAKAADVMAAVVSQAASDIIGQQVQWQATSNVGLKNYQANVGGKYWAHFAGQAVATTTTVPPPPTTPMMFR